MLTRVGACLRRQPVRAYLYGLLGPGLTVAGAYGLVSEHRAALWIALGGAVLLPAGVEAARARVTPVADPHDDQGRPLGPGRDVPPPVFKSAGFSSSDDGVAQAPDGTPYVPPPRPPILRAASAVRMTPLDNEGRPNGDPIVFGNVGNDWGPPT